MPALPLFQMIVLICVHLSAILVCLNLFDMCYSRSCSVHLFNALVCRQGSDAVHEMLSLGSEETRRSPHPSKHGVRVWQCSCQGHLVHTSKLHSLATPHAGKLPLPGAPPTQCGRGGECGLPLLAAAARAAAARLCGRAP